MISTSGGVGIEADRHHKRIASLIARKRRQSYADALRYIRARLRFCLSKSSMEVYILTKYVIFLERFNRNDRSSRKENEREFYTNLFSLIQFDWFFFSTHWHCIVSLQFESYFLSNQPLSLSRSGRNVSWISGMITHCYEKVGHVLWLFSSCNVFYVCLTTFVVFKKNGKNIDSRSIFVGCICVVHQCTLVSVRPPCRGNFCFLERCFW